MVQSVTAVVYRTPSDGSLRTRGGYAFVYKGWLEGSNKLLLVDRPAVEEPTGLGAVVETEGGLQYLRTASGRPGSHVWVYEYAINSTPIEWYCFADRVTKVLSEGVK